MAFTIQPATTIEEEVYQRVIDGIPAGEFYLRAQYVQPRRDGKLNVPLKIEGTIGEPTGTTRVMVDLYLNDRQIMRVAMPTSTVIVSVPLLPPPDVNYLRAVQGVFDTDTGIFTPSASQAGCSIVVTNYGSVHYGAALDYYRHVWLPYQTQQQSILSEWSSRLVEWYFVYHRRFPDTHAMRVLATRLASRATWHALPTTRGVQDMVAALCASEPVVEEIGNTRSTLDLALYPLRPAAANFSGYEFDIWFPDIPTAREIAVLHLARSQPYLELKDFQEGHTFLTLDGGAHPLIQLDKDRRNANLDFVLRQIGVMDPWHGFQESSRTGAYFYRFWNGAWDNQVVSPGLGVGSGFDTGALDSGSSLDSQDLFAELWTGKGIRSADTVLDSVAQVTVDEDDQRTDGPLAWEWEWTGGLSVDLRSYNNLNSTLHGGGTP